jgi:multiple antibiotic resistance protein
MPLRFSALGAARAERSGIGVLVAIAAFFLATLSVAAIVLLCYRNADRVAQLVGQEGAWVVTSLSAFLLLCVGVQMITAGAIDLARLATAQG